MVARLLDSNGVIKPFEQWVQDVLPIANHQCRSWLRTEYDTAFIRAHQAADWRQFEREADVLPNLKWMPSTSVTPGEDHRHFWGVVRPIGDPFWQQHRPGDRWNCKCSLSSTDEPVTPIPSAVPRSSEPQRGLAGNPGRDGAIFSQDHPYFPTSCKNCAFYKPGIKARLTTLFQNKAKDKDCYSCPYIDGCIERMEVNGFKLERKYENGGVLYIHSKTEKKKGDYKAIVTISRQFAEEGGIVKITPRVHIKSEEYKIIYSSLLGTKYEGKCPDFMVDGVFYEYEGFKRPWKKRKVKNMLTHGIVQSPNVVINNTKGCSDRFIRSTIIEKLKHNNGDLKEVWVYEKGKVRLFFKQGKFM